MDRELTTSEYDDLSIEEQDYCYFFNDIWYFEAERFYMEMDQLGKFNLDDE